MRSIAAIRISYTSPKTPPSTCAKATSAGRHTAKRHRLTLRADSDLRAAFRLPHPHGKAIRRHGVAACRRASARHAVPQALHRLRRRQIRNLEIDRATLMLKGPVFVGDYHRDMELVAEILKMRFFRRLQEAPARPRTRRPILSPERSHGLGHSAVHALARIHRRAQRVAAHASRRPRASFCSPSSATTARSGATTGASISPSIASTATSGHELKVR